MVDNDERWYNPQTDQWQQPDPTMLETGPNPKEYVQDSPTNFTDPMGMAEQRPQGKIAEIIQNYERTGQLPLDLLRALMSPSDRFALANAGDEKSRALILGQIEKAYQPVLDAMKPLLEGIAKQREFDRVIPNFEEQVAEIQRKRQARNPELTKGLTIDVKAIESQRRASQLAAMDADYVKVASKLVWDRLYAKNLEWSKKYYASDARQRNDMIESVLPWLVVPGIQSVRAAQGKMVPGETQEETARLMTEYMLSGRYHPMLNPIYNEEARQQYVREGLLRALPVLVMEGAAEFGMLAVRKPLGQLAATIAEKTGVTKAAGKVAGLFRRGSNVAPRKPPSVPATQELAQEILKVGKFKPGQQTVTLIETAEGQTIVAGGGTDLNAAQKAFARSKGLLVADDLPGVHAELTAIATAGERGLLPTRGVATAKVCNTGEANCIEQMNEALKGSAFGLRLSPDRRTFEFVKKGAK